MILGLIPARRGSERLHRKNLQHVGGMPLLQWTIMAAKMSKALDAICVSTDDDIAVDLAQQNNIDVIHRHPDLCRPDTPMLPVIVNALEGYTQAKTLVLLQPTSPFRRAEHIAGALEKWKACPKSRSLVSVGPDGKENGAIYIAQAGRIRAGDPLYDEAGGEFYRYEMLAAESLDIDTEADLQMARSYFEGTDAESGEVH